MALTRSLQPGVLRARQRVDLLVEDQVTHRAAGVRLGGLLFLLTTGCAVMVHEAVQRDIDENFKQGVAARSNGSSEEDSRTCPPNKIQHEDCRVTPCKVTCEDPKGAEH